ncbi:hypothetical protein Btru_017645 [Bulinus truncatus]|nr:hypothetical protein Btru_017645 [Bulinus truncatus]
METASGIPQTVTSDGSVQNASTSWLTDSLDNTCNPDSTLQTLILTWDIPQPFTWIRITSINTGRNVAFLQQTNQTTTLEDNKMFESKFAVDGIVPNSCIIGQCSHTDIFDKWPRWEVTYDQLYSVRKFVIYNRIDAVSSRLQYFQLQATDINDTVVFEYNDNQTTQLVYTVLYVAGTAIGGVKISQKHTALNQSVPFLTLSEVETYGDCLPGYWGLECKSHCTTDFTDTCHPGEGLCPYDTSSQSANQDNRVQECSGSDFGAGFGAGFGTGVGVAILIGITTFLLYRLVHQHRMESTGKPPQGSYDQTAVVASGVKHRYEGVQLEKNVVDRSYEQIDTTGDHVDTGGHGYTAPAEQNIYVKVDEQVLGLKERNSSVGLTLDIYHDTIQYADSSTNEMEIVHFHFTLQIDKNNVNMVFSVQCPSRQNQCRGINSDKDRVVTLLDDGLQVMCDTKTDGGGWITFQRRINGNVSFYRGWEEYKYGFGDFGVGEFYLGNEFIHQLTSKRHYEKRVDFRINSTNYFASYSQFKIFGEPEKYRLQISGYFGNATDNLTSDHNNQKFSTFDNDNDNDNKNCAQVYSGAWWYNGCHQSNLNGQWGSKTSGVGMNWFQLTTNYDTVSYSEMKFREINY